MSVLIDHLTHSQVYRRSTIELHQTLCFLRNMRLKKFFNGETIELKNMCLGLKEGFFLVLISEALSFLGYYRGCFNSVFENKSEDSFVFSKETQSENPLSRNPLLAFYNLPVF